MDVNQIRLYIKETDITYEDRCLIESHLKKSLSEIGIQLNEIAIGRDLRKWGE